MESPYLTIVNIHHPSLIMFASLLAVLADSEPRRSVNKISRPSNSTAGVTLVAAMEELLEEIAELLSWDDTLRVGVTRIQIDEQCGLILVRGLSDEVEYLKNCFIQIWLYARERITGIQASPLRIWKT